jgi:hypothetical protein
MSERTCYLCGARTDRRHEPMDTYVCTECIPEPDPTSHTDPPTLPQFPTMPALPTPWSDF